MFHHQLVAKMALPLWRGYSHIAAYLRNVASDRYLDAITQEEDFW